MKNYENKNTEPLRKAWSKVLRWMHRHIPTGLRTLLGFLLIVGGIFGFLPVLGFWMVPFGLAVIALDINALRKVVQCRRNQARRTDDVAAKGRVKGEK